MTSALRGRVGLEADDSTDRLLEWDSDKGGGGVKKIPIFLRTSHVNGPLCCALVSSTFAL